MFCLHCVFHIAVCCCSFSSLFDIVLSERGRALQEAEEKKNWELAAKEGKVQKGNTRPIVLQFTVFMKLIGGDEVG